MSKEVKGKIIKVLKKIPDPELNVSIWDLGFIYEIKVKGKKALIIMTLTSAGCPLFHIMEGPIKDGIKKLKEIDQVDIELTFEPPWTPERMSKKAKAELGFV